MIQADEDRNNLEEAVRLAEAGMSVFPCWEADAGRCACGNPDCIAPAKHPVGNQCPSGFKNASSTYSKIESWWTSRPTSNIAIATGSASGPGLLVVDTDIPDDQAGANVLAQVDPCGAGADDLDDVPTVRTQSGGRQFYFRMPLEGARSTTKLAGLPLDIRADGGYVIAPPSRGVKGRWSWIRSIFEHDLREPPQYILNLTDGKKAVGDDGSGLMFTFEGDLRTHPGAREGERNKLLCKLAGYHLLEHGADNLLQLSLEWGSRCRPPMPPAQVQKTIVGLVEKHYRKESEKATARVKATPRLVFKKFSEVEDKAQEWLWQGVIPSAAFSLICGPPGQGKTALSIKLCAHVSTGEPFPDGSPCAKGTAIYSSTEDDESRVLKPRLIENGADLDRVICVPGVAVDDDDDLILPLQFTEHLGLLEEKAKEIGDLRLLVLDPVVLGLGDRCDSHKNDSVRRVLAPLTAFAQRLNCAVIGITHPSKAEQMTMLSRVSGSVAFAAVARSCWAVSRDPDDLNKRLFWCFKSSYGGGIGRDFSIGEGARLTWGETPLPFNHGDATGDQEDGEAPTFEEAKRWLVAQLEAGPVPAGEIATAVKECNWFSKRTVDKAKVALGVQSYQKGRSWFWALPRVIVQGKELGFHDI